MSNFFIALKRFLQRFMPPTAKALQVRLDRIEAKLMGQDAALRNNEAKILDNQVKLQSAILDTFYLACKANEIKAVHADTFSPYKNIYRGREAVVIGNGPSLNYYTPIENAIHIGVNRTYLKKEIPLEYLFVQDWNVGKHIMEDLKGLTCKKFVGYQIASFYRKGGFCFPEYAADYIGAKKYFLNDYFPGIGINYPFPLDIEYYPIVDNWTSVFSAFCFALYTHPKRIYIVGCDCSRGFVNGDHFYEGGTPIHQQWVDKIVTHWAMMKEHTAAYYPDIEIVSINPVGLAGMFRDQFSAEFLNRAPA